MTCIACSVSSFLHNKCIYKLRILIRKLSLIIFFKKTELLSFSTVRLTVV
jgi:hypothetical protein